MPGRAICYCNMCLCLFLMTTGLESMEPEERDDMELPTRTLEIITSVSKHNCSRSFLSVGFPHFFYKWGRFQMRSRKAIALARALPHTIIRIYGSPLFTEDDIEAYRMEHRPEPDDEEEYYEEDAVVASLKGEDEAAMKLQGGVEKREASWGEDEAEASLDDEYEEEDMTHQDVNQAGNNSEDIGLMADFVDHDPYQLVLTRDLWINVVRFARTVKWGFMFGFTTFSHKNGYFNPRYARTFLEMSQREQIPIPEFQLGNEPNIYNKTWKINATQVANDFSLFVRVLREYPFYRDSKIIGPDVTQFTTSRNFFEKFLKAHGCDYVDEISFHHYYYRKERSVDTFTSIPPLNSFAETMKLGRQLMRKYNCSRPLRLTETSNAVGGGEPDVSNAFVAGFSWMDKLGQSALNNITRVFRHTFFGGFYALVEPNLKPNPDYYLSLMFKRFVEGPVFRVRKRLLPVHIRAYANCAREYPPGSLVVYLMNLGKTTEYVNFTQFSTEILSVFRFTASGDNLKSRIVLLNGEELIMRGNTIPVMKPSRELGDAVLLPSYSYAFVIISGARINACLNYFQSETAEPVLKWPDGSPMFEPANVPRDRSPPTVRGELRVILCAQVVAIIIHKWLNAFGGAPEGVNA